MKLFKKLGFHYGTLLKFNKGSIDIKLHKKHLINLTPLISQFKEAINKLKN